MCYSNGLSLCQVTVQLNIDSWPKTVSVLWQIPQYFVISISEILFVVPGLHLAYTQVKALVYRGTELSGFVLMHLLCI